jgi:hypothetical protein
MEKCKKMSEKMMLNTYRDKISKFTGSLSKKKEKELKQKMVSNGILTYCNPGCKGTIFSDDPQWFTYVKKEFQKKVNNKELTAKDVKQLLPTLHNMRNNLVKGSNSTILNKNSFYRKIQSMDNFITGKSSKTKKKISPAMYKKTLKSKGALSACSMGYL